MNTGFRSALNVFWVVARILIGGVFAYAGLSKLLEPVENFQAILNNYPILPAFAVPLIARVLPWLEWLGGCLLFMGYAPRVMAGLVGGMSFGFLISLLSVFLKGTVGELDCGCFGEGGLHLSTKQVFGMDLVNTLILIRLCFLKDFPWSVDAILRFEPKYVTKQAVQASLKGKKR